MTKSHRF